jgi:hypothetical protein
MNMERCVEKTFGIALILIIVIAGFGQAVLQLWNWLMPTIFGLPVISFWQAVGLLGLSWILFGGLRGFGFHQVRMRRHAKNRFWSLTAEERESLRKSLLATSRRKSDSADPSSASDAGARG